MNKRIHFSRRERRAALRAFKARLTVIPWGFGGLCEYIAQYPEIPQRGDKEIRLLLKWQECVDVSSPSGARPASRWTVIAKKRLGE